MMPLDLETDFSEVDTSFPLLPEGYVHMRIKELGKVRNKDDNGFNAKIVFETVNTQTSLKASQENRADDLKPGFKLTAHHPLQDKDGGTEGKWMKNIAALLEATGDKNAKFKSENLLQKELLVRVGLTTYKGNPANEIKAYKNLNELDGPETEDAKVTPSNEDIGD